METIEKFYSGKAILITGATGFMGKQLIEKLLRSCPEISSIYILVRSKKNKSAHQRWNELTNLELFERLKKEHPKNLDKVKVLDGQIHLPGFGLEQDIYEEMKKSVSIIFHVAANVRFDEPLKIAYEANVTSTINVINFALEAKKIDVFLHVSSTYSNTHEKYIGETVYPPLQDWREVGRIVTETDQNSLTLLNDKCISPSINTYTFTKHLAERVIFDYKDRLPMIIVRPSVVTPSLYEPMKGWVDNLNGPFMLTALISKGILRTMLGRNDAKLDCVPVDVSVKSFIVAAWKKGIENNDKKYDLAIYNSSTAEKNISIHHMTKETILHINSRPISKVIWQPYIKYTEYLSVFRILSFFLHFIPSLIIDSLLKIVGQKPRLLKIQIKIQNAVVNNLSSFSLNDWKFENINFLNLCNEIPEESKKNFDYSFANVDPNGYVQDSCDGIKKYVLRETESTASMIIHNNRMYVLHIIVKSIVYIGSAYAAFAYFQ